MAAVSRNRLAQECRKSRNCQLLLAGSRTGSRAIAETFTGLESSRLAGKLRPGLSVKLPPLFDRDSGVFMS
jgi:hypothetical protein